ncbi:hypothetical protein DXG01_014802 [Tephrocybe rancida]|nr:hypothetical protein DXG01_014802 [Tephrocybe rancida]
MVRLENEHLGNMDQYRITHEVPLPYSFDDAHAENADDGDDDDDDDKTLKVAATRKQNRPQPRAKMALVGHKTKKEKSG